MNPSHMPCPDARVALYLVMAGEGDDGHDTMDWIKGQDWSNGEIYTFGASADGEGPALSKKAFIQSTWRGFAPEIPGNRPWLA
jgi:hypothetical protein